MTHTKMPLTPVHQKDLYSVPTPFNVRPFVLRYGFSVAAIALPVLIFVGLRFFSISFNGSLLIIGAIVAATWYGGLGPGLTAAVLFEIAQLALSGLPPGSTPSVIFAEFNRIATVVILVLLVSSRKTAQDRLREQREWLRVTLSSIGDAVIATDLKGRVTFLNPVAESLTGWERREAIGRSLKDVFRIVNERTRSTVEDPVTKVLRDGLIVGLANHTMLISKDGSEIAIDDSGAPIREANGAIAGVILVFRDVTERKRAEQEMLRAQAADELKTKFLANMSHELRTPLNGIIGFAEFLIDQKPGPLNVKQVNYLQDILDSGQHLLDLVNEVLDLAKVEAGKIKFEPETFSLRDVLAEICGVIGEVAKKKGIEVIVKNCPDIESVTIDRQRFKQVMYNLMSNAVKFTGQGGKVTLSTSRQQGDRFTVEVADTGVGIKPKDLRMLFTEFGQLDPGRQDGTGLGLVLSKKLVELQEGSISVESEFGKGSTFTVTLPCVTR
jgi:PAS domain S-box-containing protein